MNIQPLTAVLLGSMMLSLVTVESGGLFLTKVVAGGHPATPLQTSFFRAGHAHAAVLLVLGILVTLVVDQVSGSGVIALVPGVLIGLAALLMPAGFFLSVLAPGSDRPGRMIALLWLGAASLTAGLVASGLIVLLAGIAALG